MLPGVAVDVEASFVRASKSLNMMHITTMNNKGSMRPGLRYNFGCVFVAMQFVTKKGELLVRTKT